MKKAVFHRNMGLLLILIFSILSFTFCFGNLKQDKKFAQNPDLPTVTVQSKTVHRGQTFGVEVELSNNLGLTSLCLVLQKSNFNSQVFKLVDVQRGDGLSDMTYTETGLDDEYGYDVETFRMVWDGVNQDFSNGTLVKFIFESDIEAEVGDYQIVLEYDPNNTHHEYGVDQEIEIISSTITLIKGEYTVNYLDFDDTVLYSKDFNEDDIPTYVGETPSRPEDECYSYTFVGWKGVISEDINTICYQAQYTATPQTYQLFYYVADYVNGEIGEFDFYDAVEYDYNQIVELPVVAQREHYIFYGWYIDEYCTEYFVSSRMPSHNLTLYGYYKRDIREINIPKLTLSQNRIENQIVYVDCYVVINPGFNGLILTPEYDHSALKLVGFDRGDIMLDMQFDHTQTQDYSIEGFKFYFESATNNYETGLFLSLRFEIVTELEERNYFVTFEYEPFRDATYIDEENELSYTLVEIVGANVSAGLKFHWQEVVADAPNITIEVTSADGKPLDTYLEVSLVTEQVVLNRKTINNVIGRNMNISSAYSIKLMQNGVEIAPNTILTIKITLTRDELNSENIKFGYLSDENVLTDHEFELENGNLTFTTDHLSNWIIFVDSSLNAASAGKITILVLLPSLLAVATMQYVLIIRAKNKELLQKNDEKGDK